MRILCVLALLAFAATAAAQNPDGPDGSIWLEPSYGTSFNGDWTVGSTSGSLEQRRYGLDLGAVVGSRVTLIGSVLGTDDKVREQGFLPYEESIVLITVRARIYIFGKD